MIHGVPVDITHTGIDPTFLQAFPDHMRELLNQHAARCSNLTQISAKSLDALPLEIRAEIIQAEAAERAQRTR